METQKRRRTENLKPWKPGQSKTDAIYRAMLKALLKGDPEVFAVLADRAYGKLTQKVEIPGIENLPEALAEARARDG